MVGNVDPVAVANRKQELLPEDRQIVEVRNSDIRPALQLLHRIHLTHPRLFVGNHRPALKEVAHLRPGQEPLLDEHLHPCSPGQVAELVVRALGQQEMDLLKGVQHWKTIGDDGGVIVRLEKDRGEMQQVVERLEELRSAVRRLQLGNGFPVECQPIVMVVLVSPPRHS